MNTPPIPPNCRLFKLASGGRWYLGLPYHNRKWIDEQYGEWRTIIAAVARCAWLDAEYDSQNIAFRKSIVGQTGVSNSPYFWDFFKRENAEAWRVWGEAK